MLPFRLPVLVFSTWLFVLFNIERVHAPINIATFVYVLAALGGVAVLITPPSMSRRAIYWLAPALALLFITKFVRGYPIGGTALPITLTECLALTVTIVLARWVALQFDDLRAAIFANLVADLQNRTQPFGSGQGELYREVRRARHFQRPLSFIAVAPAPGALAPVKDRLMKEVMQRMLDRYVAARLADLLSRRLKDCDVIAQRNDHFVAALPETSRDMALKMTRQLQAEARSELGIELNFGLSTCPDEEATFIGLLERAEQGLRRASVSTLAVEEIAAPHRQPDLFVGVNGADALINGQDSLLAARNIPR